MHVLDIGAAIWKVLEWQTAATAAVLASTALILKGVILETAAVTAVLFLAE